MNCGMRWLLPAVFLASLSFAGETGTTAISASLVIKVNDREAASRALIKKAEGAQGYFSNLGDTYVTIRLPNGRCEAFLAYCDSLGLVLERHYQASDYASEIGDKQVKLKARRDLLKDHFDMLQQSTAGSILTVENAISSLTAEIESLEADLKVLRHKIDFAEIRVDFQFRERQAQLRSANSLFSWINTLNLTDLREDFERGGD